MLDDHDDVQNVYGNYELSDALMAKLSASARLARYACNARALRHSWQAEQKGYKGRP